MNIIDTWVTYPMDDPGKKIAYGVLVVIIPKNDGKKENIVIK